MKTKLFLLIVFLGMFSFSYAQKGYLFIVATRGHEGATVYTSEVLEAKDFKKCSTSNDSFECVKSAMATYLIGAGERAFNFDYYYFPTEGTYSTMDEAKRKRMEAIEHTNKSGFKVKEVVLKN